MRRRPRLPGLKNWGGSTPSNITPGPPPRRDKFAEVVDAEVETTGRQITDPRFDVAFAVFTRSTGTRHNKLQRFHAAISLWYKENMKWTHDDKLVAMKSLGSAWVQWSISNFKYKGDCIKDKNDKWTVRDDADMARVQKQLSDPRSVETTLTESTLQLRIMLEHPLMIAAVPNNQRRRI